MKYSSSFIFLLLTVLGATFLLIAGIAPSPTRNKKVAPEKTTNEANGIAVVELFTSQGCSSCPPADKLLRSIAQRATEQGLTIYPLSFHVDYWNRLGWQDPYSQPTFSQRQREYARTWDNAQIYTPQMVVNGKTGFVGSKQQQAWKVIDEALTQAATATVSLEATTSDGRILVNYQLTGAFADHHLQLALVEKEVETLVRRGENSGRKLHHSQLVREFVSEQPNENGMGTVGLSLPNDLLPQDAKLLAYVQDPSTLTINGASSLELEAAVN